MQRKHDIRTDKVFKYNVSLNINGVKHDYTVNFFDNFALVFYLCHNIYAVIPIHTQQMSHNSSVFYHELLSIPIKNYMYMKLPHVMSLHGQSFEPDISISIHGSSPGSFLQFPNTENILYGVYYHVIGFHGIATTSRTLYSHATG